MIDAGTDYGASDTGVLPFGDPDELKRKLAALAMLRQGGAPDAPAPATVAPAPRPESAAPATEPRPQAIAPAQPPATPAQQAPQTPASATPTPSTAIAPANANPAPAKVSFGPATARLNEFDANNPSQVKPLHGGMKALDIIGKILAPRIEHSIRYGGAEENAANRGPLAAAATQEQAQAEEQARIGQQEAATGAETARQKHEEASTEALKDKPEDKFLYQGTDENGNSIAVFQGPNGVYSKQAGFKEGAKPVAQSEKISPLAPEIAAQFPEPQKKDYPTDAAFQQAHQQWGKQIDQQKLKEDKEKAIAGRAPQQQQQTLMIGPDRKVIEVRPGMTIPKGSETPAQIGKPSENASNDEKRRGDLANNLNENLDSFEEIVKRRPELFGPVAGRLTRLRMATGSSDPDIAALNTIHEQTGLAMVGTHAMRNAQHAEKAADSIMNRYTMEPAALLNGSIPAARKSLHTFVEDVQGNKLNSIKADENKNQGAKQNPFRNP